MSESKKLQTLPIPDRWDGTPEGKKKLHKEISEVLRALASKLGLKVGRKPGDGDCEISSNPMGEALGGYVYFMRIIFIFGLIAAAEAIGDETKVT